MKILTFFFKTELFICIFAPGECPISKGFIDACVFDSVMQALTVDLQEKSIKIKNKNKKITIRLSSIAATK